MQARQQLLYEMLVDTKSAFDETNVSYFLMHGTLIGALRDNDIIEFTHDVDLGISGEEGAVGQYLLRSDVRNALAARRLGIVDSLVDAKDTLHDLCRIGPAPSRLYTWLALRCGWFPRVELLTLEHWGPPFNSMHAAADKCKYPVQWFSPIYASKETKSNKPVRKTTVRGIEFPIPERAEDILNMCYGPGWRTPLPPSERKGSYGIPNCKQELPADAYSSKLA